MNTNPGQRNIQVSPRLCDRNQTANVWWLQQSTRSRELSCMRYHLKDSAAIRLAATCRLAILATQMSKIQPLPVWI